MLSIMEQHRWLIYAALSALCASAVAIFAKLGMEKADSTLATAVRSIIMTGFLMAVVTAMGLWSKVRELTPRPLAMIVLSGIAGAASWLFYFKALASPGGDVSKVAPIDKLSMPLGILLAVLILGDRPTAVNWLGIALVVAGAYLASIKG
jgi:bacterial/archaeal transporter family protein